MDQFWGEALGNALPELVSWAAFDSLVIEHHTRVDDMHHINPELWTNQTNSIHTLCPRRRCSQLQVAAARVAA